MFETSSEVKQKRDELKAKRNLLFQRLLKNPAGTQLALEIKTIDDQVAEFDAQMLEKIHEARMSPPEEWHKVGVLCSSLPVA